MYFLYKILIKTRLNEIVEMLCVGVLLKETKIPSTNKLALKCLDQATEIILKEYCKKHQIAIKKTSDLFSTVVPILKERNLIIPNYEKSLINLHKLSERLSDENITVEKVDVENYTTLVKILLAYLHHYRASKKEWLEKASNLKKVICSQN